jgi:hypothetical protein
VFGSGGVRLGEEPGLKAAILWNYADASRQRLKVWKCLGFKVEDFKRNRGKR